MRDVVSVKYYCPCRETEVRDVPEFLDDGNCFHELEYLYFCEVCATIRCQFCIDKDPVSWFCPSCLFEVTSTDATSTSNTCPRNCLSCPLCRANVIAHVQGDEGYKLACSLCEWKMEGFVKGKSLVSQVIEKQDAEAAFNVLLEGFKNGTPVDELPAAQKHEPLLPVPVRLRAKYTKHCMACRNLLVQPDPKASLAKFKVKTMAIDAVPRIIAAKSSETPEQIVLTFINPTPIPIKLGLALQPGSSHVNLANTAVILGPDKGKLDEANLLRQVPESFVKRESTTSRQIFMEGIRKKDGYEHGPNWASIPMAILGERKPVNILANFQFQGGAGSPELGLWFQVLL